MSHPRIANRLPIVGLLRRDDSKHGKQVAPVHGCAEGGLPGDGHSDSVCARASGAALPLAQVRMGVKKRDTLLAFEVILN